MDFPKNVNSCSTKRFHSVIGLSARLPVDAAQFVIFSCEKIHCLEPNISNIDLSPHQTFV